jgi:hypothetical protein
MGVYLLFGRNGKQIGGVFDKGKHGRPGAAHWVGYVRVPDVHATVATVEAEGGTLLNGPMEVPGDDWIAQFSDPHGALFAVLTTAKDLKAARGAKAAASKAGGVPAKPAASKAGGAPAKPAMKAAKKAAKKKGAKKKAAKKTGKKKAGKKKAGKKKAKRAAAKKGKARKRKSKRRR